jgi:hypothetical protein
MVILKRLSVLIAGACIMLSFSGCSDKGFKYSKYSNGNPKINLSIDYPLGWKCIAYKDDLTGLPTVLFAPADNRGIFNAYVAIEVISPEAFPGKVFTAESLAENIFSRAMKLPKASLDSKSMTSRGEELKVSFDMPETLNKRGAKLLPRRRILWS